MSRYAYAGPYKNPTEGMKVMFNEGTQRYYIAVPDYCECGNECCSRPLLGYHPHTGDMLFNDEDEAYEWLEGTEEFFERDYEDYLEENHDDIVRMEQYEAYKNEY